MKLLPPGRPPAAALNALNPWAWKTGMAHDLAAAGYHASCVMRDCIMVYSVLRRRRDGDGDMSHVARSLESVAFVVRCSL